MHTYIPTHLLACQHLMLTHISTNGKHIQDLVTTRHAVTQTRKRNLPTYINNPQHTTP